MQPIASGDRKAGIVGPETSLDVKTKENQEQKDSLQSDKKQSLHKIGGYSVSSECLELCFILFQYEWATMVRSIFSFCFVMLFTQVPLK